MKAYRIECRSGCSCCSDQNHVRGPYRTREEAQRRIDSFLAKDSKFWPVASQYARRGRYHIMEEDAEEISQDRILVNDRVLYGWIEVDENGDVEDHYDEEAYETGY